MKANLSTTLYRASIIVIALALMAFMLPQPVQAAAPTIRVVWVIPDTSVRIRADNFPGNQTMFTVRMAAAGNLGINGTVVTVTNSGVGGSFEETYAIPSSLRGVGSITIRMESPFGQIAYATFTNAASSSSGGTSTIPVTGGTTTGAGPNIKIIAVDSNERITVRATGLPLYTYFEVRVGPFYTFAKQGEVVEEIYTGSTSTFDFNVDLPDIVHNVDLVTVRLDSSNGWYAYNAFHNVNSGTVTSGSGVVVYQDSCDIIWTKPSDSVSRNADFDGSWKIENTSDENWNLNQVDYKYVSGTKFKIDDKRYDLPKTVKPGQTVVITVDMVAPSTAGVYNTEWAVVQGNTTLCELPLRVVVK